MHPAPSLAELLKSDDPRAQPQQQPPQQQQQPPLQQISEQSSSQTDQHQPLHEASGYSQSIDLNSPSRLKSPLPVRKDTGSSISTVDTDVTVTSNATSDSNSTGYSVESSQSIFSVKDGAEVSGNRRASRRRTGPLSAAQREKAALIRKLGACPDCRRRRVACHPNHHDMTWEDAIRKYQTAHSPLQELAPLAGRPISPASSLMRHGYIHDSQEMDIDSTPTPPATQTTPGRAPLSDSRIRTPLPSGPRLEAHLTMAPLAAAPATHHTLPNIDFIKSELDGAASRYLSGPYTGRYTAVQALLICWQDDDSFDVSAALEDMRSVLQDYAFSPKVIQIPPTSTGACRNSQRWLSREINDFTEDRDTRDVLKIIYYNGCTSLIDGEMVLSSPLDHERSSIIRWGGIQEFFEGARSDIMILFDAVYHASSRMTRRDGVLELIAASASEEHFALLGKSTFTKLIVQQLRMRLAQRLQSPLSAAELHTKLISAYSKMTPEKQSPELQKPPMPLPLHLHMSGNSKLPSITLNPLQAVRPQTPSFHPELQGGYHLTLSIRLTDDHIDTDCWSEWLRMMPDGVNDVKVVGPYHTLR